MQKSKIFIARSLLKAKFFKRRAPLITGWCLTNRCNWSCGYCGREFYAQTELNTRQVCAIIDELSAMGAYAVSFTGGEPFLREDIGEIVDYTKKKGIRVSIMSNGSFIPQRINEIKNMDFLTISYDGPQEIHDIQRQEGTYQYVVRAVEAAKERNMRLNLHTVLTVHNIDRIDSILAFAKVFNIATNFAVIEAAPLSKKERIKTLFPPREKFRKAIRFLISEKRKGNKNIGNTLSGLTHLYGWPEQKKISCCAGKIYSRIESNGDLYPCGNLILGNNPPNCVAMGFKNAFERLRTENCKECWCDTRVEMNNIYSLKLGSILDLNRTYRL